mmetsp:Transcript_10179/g.14937  ORF Transcript_10179/g.14937 Transcript_10179/m.14937 type:complete len:253 (+) Transcript_10179:167-925(+)
MRNWGEGKSYAGQIKRAHYLPNQTHVLEKQTTAIQSYAYMECVREAVARNVSWVAAIDLDEFLVLHTNHTRITDFMNSFCPISSSCGQLSFNWVPFGDKNRTRFIDAPVAKRFMFHGAPETWVKAIANPNAVDADSNKAWLHTFPLKPGWKWLDTSGQSIYTRNERWKFMHNFKKHVDVAALYHFSTLSEEERKAKRCERGDVNNFPPPDWCTNSSISMPQFTGLSYDDSLWKKMTTLLPTYQKYDNASDLG